MEGGRVKAMLYSRINDRYELPDFKVEYTLDSISSDEIYEADLINYSEVGLCMLSPHRLTVGQEIILKNFMDYSSRTAVVIWVEEVEASFDESGQVLFKTGLQFS